MKSDGSASRLSILLRRRFREWRNALRRIPSQSKLKTGVILGFALLFETGLFLLFRGGFRFLRSFGGPGALLVGRLFSVYFLAMAIMLILSSAVVAYGALFRSRDVNYLLTVPLEIRDIMTAKWFEITGISSWAFFFIVAPFVAAYAVHEGFSPLFVLWTLLCAIPWLLACAALGALLALAFGRGFPRPGRGRRIVQILAVGVAGIIVARFLARIDRQAAVEATRLRNIIPGLRWATHPLSPGFWMSEALFALRDHNWRRGVNFFLLICAHALVLGVLLEILGEAWFHTAWTRIASSASLHRRPRSFRLLRRALAWIPDDVRAIVVKDTRMFWRDPIQWTQTLMFFGLLAVYFANLRTFQNREMSPLWLNFVAFLNAFSLSAVLCSLTSRFVYPRISIEGQSYWLLGLSPTGPARIVLTKFFSSLLTLGAVTVPLMGLSTSMLGTPAESRLTIMILIGCLTLAVCGLAVGLGAIFADLEHNNPAEIVSGFGGTLNLVLNLIVTVAILAPFAFLFHRHAVGDLETAALRRILPFALGGALAAAGLAASIPLRLGVRSLARRDF